jgi:diguanylate cyclase (GGDEF)-like protein
VVVADGLAARRRMAVASLSAAGYDVLQATNGDQALSCWRAAAPDVVLLDVDLAEPRPSGAEVLRTLCAGRHGDSTGVVVTMSSDPGVGTVVDALAGGARDHLRWPFEPAELLARVGSVLRIADAHERLRRRNEELAYLGSTDELTGLATRRHIEDELFRLAAAAARYHQPLSAVLLAIDRWGEIDASGAVRADGAVQEVAVLISAIARTGDLTSRFSDSEFLVLLPMTDAEGARMFAERARAVVAAVPVATDDGPVDVSLSVGCATGATGPRELLARALAALRQAQATGGDRLISIVF